jgi:hypothetical protein
MCYVITLMLPPTTIISRATAITVRSPASSPGGVLDCTKAKYCCYRPGARTLKDKGWGPKKYGGNNCSRRGPMSKLVYGSTTVSMTWITPLLVTMSVFTTLALSTVTPSEPALMSSSLPLTVLAFIVFTSAAMTLPAITW